MQVILQCDAPYSGHLTKFLTNYPPRRVCEFDGQSRLLAKFVRLKLNTIAWVVELTYLHIVVKCESLLGGYGKVRCTVKGSHCSFLLCGFFRYQIMVQCDQSMSMEHKF